MKDVDVRIRRAEGLRDYQACIELQKEVWGYTEMEDIAAQPMLMIANRGGGSVLVAQNEADRFIGFAFALPCWSADKKLFWWSHMTAVVQDYRNKDVGLGLKMAQRDAALAEGVHEIKWTFDPLQAMNGYFNVQKLGVIVREYEENVYGYTNSPLHRGLPTDRFLAEWYLDADRVKERLEGGEGGIIMYDLDRIQKVNDVGGAPYLVLEDTPLLLEIPSDLNALRQTDLARAKAWQDGVREASLHYFKAGYVVTGFIRVEGLAGYLLSRTSVP